MKLNTWSIDADALLIQVQTLDRPISALGNPTCEPFARHEVGATKSHCDVLQKKIQMYHLKQYSPPKIFQRQL
jgi:hypothetical protein